MITKAEAEALFDAMNRFPAAVLDQVTRGLLFEHVERPTFAEREVTWKALKGRLPFLPPGYVWNPGIQGMLELLHNAAETPIYNRLNTKES